MIGVTSQLTVISMLTVRTPAFSGAVAGMFCDAISKLFKVLRSRKTPPPFPENWGGGI